MSKLFTQNSVIQSQCSQSCSRALNSSYTSSIAVIVISLILLIVVVVTMIFKAKGKETFFHFENINNKGARNTMIIMFFATLLTSTATSAAVIGGRNAIKSNEQKLGLKDYNNYIRSMHAGSAVAATIIAVLTAVYIGVGFKNIFKDPVHGPSFIFVPVMVMFLGLLSSSASHVSMLYDPNAKK